MTRSKQVTLLMCSSYSQKKKKKMNEKAGMTEIKAAVYREPVQ